MFKTMYSAFLLPVGVLVSQIWRISCWNLSDLSVEDDYYVSSIALHRSRAFLALPRSACSNKITYPTLIETSWYGDVFNKFHNTKPKQIGFQDWNDCEGIQDAISLETEPGKAKLWILDKGNEQCPPKMVSYSLIFNSIADSVELENMDGKGLNVLVMDKSGHRAYIGQVDGNVLLVFSLRKLIWWKIRLLGSFLPVQADFLAVSKTGSDLFVTGRNDLELFSINLDEVRSLEEPLPIDAKDVLLDFNVTVRGEKLGVCTGIETDFDSGLIYYLPRDYAVVRWDTRYPLQAEYHQVLDQSYEIFPYVSGFFTDILDSTWAIANPDSFQECSREKVRLEKRVVRLMRFNKFLQEIEIENNFDDEEDDDDGKRYYYVEEGLNNENKISKLYENDEEKEDLEYEEIVTTPQTFEVKGENGRIDGVKYGAVEDEEIDNGKRNNSDFKEEFKNVNKTKEKGKSYMNNEKKEKKVKDIQNFEYKEIVSTPQTTEVIEESERINKTVENDEYKEKIEEVVYEKRNNAKKETKDESKTKEKGESHKNNEEKETEVKGIEKVLSTPQTLMIIEENGTIVDKPVENYALKEKFEEFDNRTRNNSDFYAKEELKNENKTNEKDESPVNDEEKVIELKDIKNSEYEDIYSTPQPPVNKNVNESVEIKNTVTDKIDVQQKITTTEESTENNPIDFETLIDNVEGL